MKVSLTGPLMGVGVTVYLTDPAFGGERAFEPGSEIEAAVLTQENQKKVAGLVEDGYAVPIKAPAKKGAE